MKIRELLQLLDGIDPDTPIVIRAVDPHRQTARHRNGVPLQVDIGGVNRIGAGGTNSVVEIDPKIDLHSHQNFQD